jgi:rfaE bifunctional protein kinase chain/domain
MTAAEILRELPNRSALVAGDICLDRWCSYDPALDEPSRETGIPRVAVVSTEVTPGAGGAVANNLASLGIGRVAVLGAVGDDGHGYELKKALNVRGIDTELLALRAGYPTFTYTKLLNSRTGEEDRARVDFVYTRNPPETLEAEMIEHLRAFADAFDVIFVVDQAETKRGGVVTPALRATLAELALANPQKVIWADSRIRAELFRHVTVKCNESEAQTASVALFGDIDYRRLRATLEAPVLFVTQGERGALVVEAEGQAFAAAKSIEKPVDVCGAGDGFSAGAAMALAIGGSPIDAARFGNLVASVSMMKRGTATATPEEVLALAE